MNSILCVGSGGWTHCICTGVERWIDLRYIYRSGEVDVFTVCVLEWRDGWTHGICTRVVRWMGSQYMYQSGEVDGLTVYLPEWRE